MLLDDERGDIHHLLRRHITRLDVTKEVCQHLVRMEPDQRMQQLLQVLLLLVDDLLALFVVGWVRWETYLKEIRDMGLVGWVGVALTFSRMFPNSMKRSES